MSQSKKVTILAIMAVIIAAFSLLFSFTSLNNVDVESGIAARKIEDFDVDIDLVNDFYISEDNTLWLEEPNIDNEEISFGISLYNLNSKGQFSFNVENKGDIDAKLKAIVIEGLDDYNDYLDYSIIGLSVGDIIEATKIYTCKFVIAYKEVNVDEEGNVKTINLNNVKIRLEFGK